MRKLVLAAFFFACVAANAQQLVFTTVMPGNCPVWVSAPERSPDFGFQSLNFFNDSGREIQALYLKVTFSTGKPDEQVVDSGHIYLNLEPGVEKRQEVFLGRITALTQKLKSMGEAVAWVKLTVESAEFEDGTRWDPDAPTMDLPLELPKRN